MKKYLFGIAESILLVLLVLWFIFILNYYKAINLNMSWLPTVGDVDQTSSNQMTSVIGFQTVVEMGATLLIIGIGGLIAYFMVMIALYFTKIVSKTVIFWLNIGFFSIFLVASILGILFVNLPL